MYTWVERGTVRVKCLAQEHNTMSPARPRTRTTRSGVECTNHEAIAPPKFSAKMVYKRVKGWTSGWSLPALTFVSKYPPSWVVGGTVASWLVRLTPEQAVWVRALAGDIVLCSWARHFTLTVPLSTQVYKWVLANLMLGGNPAMD